MNDRIRQWAHKQALPHVGVRLLFYILIEMADRNGLIPVISVSALSEAGWQSPATIFRGLKLLEELGLMQRFRTKSSAGIPIVSAQLCLERSISRESKTARSEVMSGESHL